LKRTSLIIDLADRSCAYPDGVIEDVLVQVDKLVSPADFFILDMGDASNDVFILLGRPFLKTTRTKIDVHTETLSMEFDGDVIKFDIFDAMKFPSDVNHICALSVMDELSQAFNDLSHKDELETKLNMSLDASEHMPYVLHDELVAMIESFCQVSSIEESEKICLTTEHDKLLPSLISPSTLDLQYLPENLKCVYLGDDETLHAIISSVLKLEQEEKLVRVLREHRQAFG